MRYFVQCIAALFGCLGFAFVFRIHRHFKYALISSIGGMIGWIVYILINQTYNVVYSSLVAMMAVAFYSEIMARVFKAPATIFIVVGCFPLVPGRGIYQTMLYLVNNNQVLFKNALFETIGIALALAMAILIVSTVFKVIKQVRGLI